MHDIYHAGIVGDQGSRGMVTHRNDITVKLSFRNLIGMRFQGFSEEKLTLLSSGLWHHVV
jgi:hypothetical protein